MKGIYLVRHAPTSANDPGAERIRGWMDAPVNREGKTIARERADFFANRKVSHIFYSPLERAKMMAEAIEAETLAPMEEDRRLMSWNMGKFQGKPASKVTDEINAYMLQYPDKKIPDGESYRDFATRFIGFLKAHWSGEDVVAVTHFRCMVLAAAYAKGDGKIDLETLKKGKSFDDVGVAVIRPNSFTVLKRSPEFVGVS